MKAMIAGVCLLMLGGCANTGQNPWQALTSNASCAKLNSDQQLSLNLADDMASDGKLHASLANLQSLPDNIADVRLRKAKAYRLLGRSEAEPLYRSLLGSCLAAEAEHGLGQLAAARSRFEFLTAMELKQSDQLAALNLVTLLLYQDDWNRAAELVSRLGLSPAQFSEAQGRAEKLKVPSPATAAVTAMLK